MSESKPKCPHCGQSNCVSCRAGEALERLRGIRAEMPTISEEDRERYHQQSSVLSLHVSMQQLVIDVALRELARLATGQHALCERHLAPPADSTGGGTLADEVRETGFESSGLVRHLSQNDEAVTRHTLARFARLWQELRPALPSALVTRSDVRDVVKELDVVTSEVLP